MRSGQRTLGMFIGLMAWLSTGIVEGEPSRQAKSKQHPRTISAPTNAVEGARHAIVVLEQGGRPLSLGFVLADDGRILTALSPLGRETAVDIRYADGARGRAHLEHSDRAWDLALLAPERAHRTPGLAAAESPANVKSRLSAFTASARRLRAIPVLMRGRTTFLGKETRRNEALELAGSLGESDLGTPILDETGAVVALATRGCLLVDGGRGEACLPVPVGAPVAVLRRFLSTAPTPPPPAPWLGAQVVPDATPYARGLRIQAVQPESPAHEARLRGGPKEQADLVVAVDGVPVATPEALSEAIRRRAVGDVVTFLVLGAGQFREVPVVLQAAPTTSATE